MIDSYSFGSIRVDGRTYKKDLVIFPERVKSSWWRKTGHLLSLEDIGDILDYRPEILVIGTGAMGLMKVDKTVTDRLKALGIDLVAAKTADAVEEYNRVSGDRKAVFAAHLTC